MISSDSLTRSGVGGDLVLTGFQAFDPPAAVRPTDGLARGGGGDAVDRHRQPLNAGTPAQHPAINRQACVEVDHYRLALAGLRHDHADRAAAAGGHLDGDDMRFAGRQAADPEGAVRGGASPAAAFDLDPAGFKLGSSKSSDFADNS